MKKLFSPLAFFSWVASAAAAKAEYIGMARPWQLGFQPPATPVMEQLYAMYTVTLLVLIRVISILVLLLLTYICMRFHHKRNPVASKVAHNTKLEIIWTILPIFILVFIAIPSLRLHYFMQRVVDPQMTVKVTGYQWYWHYDYPDNGGFGFDSYIKKGADLKPGDIRQLAVDNALVVPVNTKIRVQITGADVIHSWAVPAFGVKKDAMPGRLNETWFEATKIGTFYGQCSQLCGVGHGFMPVAVKVVSKEDFAAWVKGKQPAVSNANAPESPQAPENKQQHVETVPQTNEGARAVPASPKQVAPAKKSPAANTQVPLAQPQPNLPETKPQTSDDKTTHNETVPEPAAETNTGTPAETTTQEGQ